MDLFMFQSVFKQSRAVEALISSDAAFIPSRNLEVSALMEWGVTSGSEVIELVTAFWPLIYTTPIHPLILDITNLQAPIWFQCNARTHTEGQKVTFDLLASTLPSAPRWEPHRWKSWVRGLSELEPECWSWPRYPWPWRMGASCRHPLPPRRAPYHWGSPPAGATSSGASPPQCPLGPFGRPARREHRYGTSWDWIRLRNKIRRGGWGLGGLWLRPTAAR